MIVIDELWKGVVYNSVDYSWRLEISNYGRLRNTKTNHIYKSFLNQGYCQISISINGKNKIFLIHKCVAEAFINNLENKPQVNHKDGNKSNNEVSNLEWVSNKENTRHAWQNNLIGNENACIKLRQNRKLSNSDILFIRKNSKDYSGVQLSKMFNVSPMTISKIINFKIYADVVG